jgi:DNA-directed RNA polymerase specialized sigma subunit
LTRLAEENERMAQVVELRIFSGMTAKEVGHVLDISRPAARYRLNPWYSPNRST